MFWLTLLLTSGGVAREGPFPSIRTANAYGKRAVMTGLVRHFTVTQETATA